MKASIVSIALAFALCLSFNLTAQNFTIWQGGKPGRATDWNCAENWSKGHVPDEFTQVIIPTTANYFPVIHYAPTPIDALLMEGGAKLTIQAGAKLLILGETGIFDGITLLGHFENNGTLEIGEAVSTGVAYFKQVEGSGIIVSPSAGMDSLARRR